MLSTIIIYAVFGAIGSAIGVGLTALIYADREPADRPKWPAGVGLALAVAFSGPAARWFNTPTADSVMAELEQQQPVFALMRDKEPASYTRFRALVESMVAAGHADRERAAREGRPIIAEIVSRRSRTASDEVVTDMVDLLVDQTAALQQRPDICVSLLAGRPAGDISNLLNDDLKAREMQLYTRLLSEDAQPATAIPDEQIDRIAQRIVPAAAREAGVDLDAMSRALQGQGDAAVSCRAGRAFFSQLRQLQPAERGAFVRATAQSE